MSARKLSDKEFDRYAKNLLKKPEGVAFDEAAWSAMEQQLVQAGPTPFIDKFKWLISLGIIVLVSVGYLGYQSLVDPSVEQVVVENQQSTSDFDPNTMEYGDDRGSENQSTDDLVVEDEDSENVATESENSEEQAQLAGLNSGRADATKPKNAIISEDQSFNSQTVEQPISRTDLANANQVSDDNKESMQPAQDELLEENSESVQVSRTRNVQDVDDSGEPTTEQAVPKESLPSSERPQSVQGILEQEVAGEALQDEKEEQSLEVESIKNEVFLAQVEKRDLILLPESEEVRSDSVQNQEEFEPYPRWSVGLTVAPDFSTVGELNEFTRPGMDVGLTVEYFIFRRLSVTTGAILTRKLYNTTDLSEYTFPAGLWNGGEAPEEILANCKVIDIPINLRYRIIEGKRTSVFASAGISSYLMLNERYDYNYAAGQYSNQPRGWEVSNENNHFFGVYNLSAGVSRRIGRHIYVEAEPFLKNSLGGVGWGQVRLKSTGMLFHIKYNF